VLDHDLVVDLFTLQDVGVTFDAVGDCSDWTATSVTLLRHTSSVSFRARATQAGPNTLQARASGALGASLEFSVVSGAPARLEFVTPPPSIPAGTCSSFSKVQLLDLWGNLAAATDDLTLDLTVSPLMGWSFHTSGSGCERSVTSITLHRADTQVEFGYSGQLAGQARVTISCPSLTARLEAAEQTFTIVPESPSRLSFDVSLAPRVAGSCAGPLHVQVRDSYNNLATASSLHVVSLAGTAGFSFFGAQRCDTAMPFAFGVAAGQSESPGFWLQGTLAGEGTVTASSGDLAGATTTVQIEPGGPTRLVFVDMPTHVERVGCTTGVGVRSQDAHGNISPVPGDLTVTLSTTPAGGMTFTTNRFCNNATSTVVILAEAFLARFGITPTTSGNITVRASASGFSDATATVSVMEP
jgi:hypothetical protein